MTTATSWGSSDGSRVRRTLLRSVVTVAVLLATPALASESLSPKLAGDVLDVAHGDFDLIHAGFGHRGKQVPGTILTLVARRHAETGDPRLRELLTRTLDAMARGAIRDHLGGGFFRHTTDRAWRKPHVEQLDVIQAQVVFAYLLGYQATGAPAYRAVAEEVLAYTDRVLARPGGGFNAGQGTAGDTSHFLWREADVRAALSAGDADLLVRHFGLAGVTEPRALAIDVGAGELAAAAGVSLEVMEGRLLAAKDRLRKARAARGEPAVDATVYADRSARLASAYLEAYKVLGGDGRLRVALDTLDFLWTRLRQPDGSMAHAFRSARVIADGALDDQFAVAGAFLDAYEVTGAARHLDSARALVTHAVARFRAADGGFFDAPHGRVQDAPHGRGDAASLKPFVDGDRPGGNALAALVLDRLHELTNDAAYRTAATDTLAALPASALPLGPQVATYAYAADVHVNGALHVVIAGKAADPRTRTLWRGALRAFRPGKIVAAYDPDLIDAAAVPAPVAAMLRQTSGAEPRAYVCSGTVCSLPQTDAERLRELVEYLGGGRRPPAKPALEPADRQGLQGCVRLARRGIGMNIVVTAKGETHAFECGDGENILYAGLGSGIALPYECGTGTCGTCKAQLGAGEVSSAWPEAPGYAGLKPGEILMCQALPGTECALEVRTAVTRMPEGACIPRRLGAIIRRRTTLTHDVATFDVELEEPIEFEAGQFMVMTVPGISGGRAYSMVNYDRPAGRLLFVVKSKPGGRLSEWFFGDGVEGTHVRLFGPLGHATFHPEIAKDLLCIAGGSGIAGMMAILSLACQARYFDEHRGYVFFGVRTGRDLFFLDELRGFASAFPERLRVTLALSEEDVDAELGAAHPLFAFDRGFVHAVASAHMKGKFANVRAYAAGPPPMVSATLRMLLLEGKLKSADIRYDKFS